MVNWLGGLGWGFGLFVVLVVLGIFLLFFALLALVLCLRFAFSPNLVGVCLLLLLRLLGLFSFLLLPFLLLLPIGSISLKLIESFIDTGKESKQGLGEG